MKTKAKTYKINIFSFYFLIEKSRKQVSECISFIRKIHICEKIEKQLGKDEQKIFTLETMLHCVFTVILNPREESHLSIRVSFVENSPEMFSRS